MDLLKLTSTRMIESAKASWIARVLLAVMFTESVTTHVLHYDMVLIDAIKVGVPFAPVSLPISLATELFGIIALITGWQYRLGILLLMGFTFISSAFFFPFWLAEGAEAVVFRQQFLKNMALIGCLLLMHSIGKNIFKSK